jgi:hypothetical protein
MLAEIPFGIPSKPKGTLLPKHLGNDKYQHRSPQTAAQEQVKNGKADGTDHWYYCSDHKKFKMVAVR